MAEGLAVARQLLAVVIGYAVIAWLLNWLRSRSLTVFVVYRLILGAVILATVFLRG